MTEDYYESLPEIRGEYRHNYNLAHLTWFKAGGSAKVFFKPLDIEDLSHFLSKYPKENPIFVLGAGSNIIIRDGGIDSIVVKLGRNFTNIEILENNKLRVGAGNLNYNLAQFCYNNGIEGFEFLIGVPGTIGGGIAMNAGSYGVEFKDIIDSVIYLDREGKKHEILCKDIGFGYRHNNLPEDLIFVEAIFHFKYGKQHAIKEKMENITKQRQASQPVTEKTGGSTFANPPEKKAWELVDAVGMRGAKFGDAEFSPIHCNFMINTGNATSTDLEELGELARKKVFEQFGINLKWEIKRVGKKS
jgi:UDP-N-acetylmuramate dehydrogenase